MAEIRCPKCGKIFPSSGDAPRFCSACGAALQTERDDKRELLNAAASGMSKKQMEEMLAARGVKVSGAAVQADIKKALSK